MLVSDAEHSKTCPRITHFISCKPDVRKSKSAPFRAKVMVTKVEGQLSDSSLQE